MTKVNCSVNNCSFNKDEICYAERVAIGGKGATQEVLTCCGTFLDNQAYSNLAEHTEYKKTCDAVSCTVATCEYHQNNLCTLATINVSAQNQVNLYSETDCSSFKLR